MVHLKTLYANQRYTGDLVNGERQLIEGKVNIICAFVHQIDIPDIHTAISVGIHLVEIGAGLQGERVGIVIYGDIGEMGDAIQGNADVLARCKGDGQRLGEGHTILSLLAIGADAGCGAVGKDIGCAVLCGVKLCHGDLRELDPAAALLVIDHADIPRFHAAQVDLYHVFTAGISREGLHGRPVFRTGKDRVLLRRKLQMILLPFITGLVTVIVTDDKPYLTHLLDLAQVEANVVAHQAVVASRVAASIGVVPDKGIVVTIKQIALRSLVDRPAAGADDLRMILHIGIDLEFGK